MSDQATGAPAVEDTAAAAAAGGEQQVEQAAAAAASADAPQIGDEASPQHEALPGFFKTGNPGLDTAIDFIAKSGLAGDDPAYLAAQRGDFSQLRVKFATMQDQGKVTGWDAVLNLAEASFKEARAKVAERNAALQNTAHELAGSPEAWTEIRAWASKNADPQERADLNAALRGRNALAAKAALKYIVDAYHKQNGQPPVRGVREDAGSAGAAASGGPLSPREYSAAVQELARKVGNHKLDSSPEYAKLQQRRRAYRG